MHIWSSVSRVVSACRARYDQDMAIEFLCPNGHALAAPDDRAGRPGKCPKCAVSFRVPEHSSAATRAASASESMIRSGGITEVKLAEVPRPDAKKTTPGSDEMIVFLCPNGHKLNGPARLQGRPGQCPYCGAKFRIPDQAEIAAGQEALDDEHVVTDEPADAGMRVREIPENSGSSKIRKFGDVGSGIRHPPAYLWPDIMADMWRHRPPGGVVEIHLADGKMITPQWYAADLSGPGHGSFAVADGEGSYTLVSIAWASVTRVEIHGVIELPDEMSG